MRTLDETIENILEVVEDCLNHEKKSPEGILNHVKTIIPIYNNEYGIEEPAIWIVQHPITVNGDENLSQILELKSTIEFACVEYDPDPKIAEQKARRLASNVALAIKNNYRRIQYDKFEDRIIENVKFNTLYPVGEIPVEGKMEKIPVAGIVLDFEFNVDWVNYC